MLDFENIDYDPTCNHLFQWLNETCWEASLHHITLQLTFGRKEYTKHVEQQVASLLVNPSCQVLNSNPVATCSWFTIRWAQSPVLNGVITSYGFVKWVTGAITPMCYKWSEKILLILAIQAVLLPITIYTPRRELNSLIYSGQIIIFHQPRFPERRGPISLTFHHHLRWKLGFSVAS